MANDKSLDPAGALQSEWPTIRKLFARSFTSSFHFSIASVDAEGRPHVAPIGSLLLDPVEPKAIYFEIFATTLAKHARENPNVCVLAVNSGAVFWFKSLFRGQFVEHPSIRLYGKLGKRRPAKDQEKSRWLKRTRMLRLLPGYKLLWGNLSDVREIEFKHFDYAKLGRMTKKTRPSP